MTGNSWAADLAGEFLPRFDTESVHSTRIAAPATVVYREARELKLSASPLVRVLFALRGMPTATLRIRELARVHFEVLREAPPRGFVFGLIGKFWTPRGCLVEFRPDEFAGFHAPGYAKAIWSFEITDAGGTSTLTTVTRVLCLDDASRRSFRRYWRIVRPFSGLIRREALRIIKVRSERHARNAGARHH